MCEVKSGIFSWKYYFLSFKEKAYLSLPAFHGVREKKLWSESPHAFVGLLQQDGTPGQQQDDL